MEVRMGGTKELPPTKTQPERIEIEKFIKRVSGDRDTPRIRSAREKVKAIIRKRIRGHVMDLPGDETS